MEILAIGEPLMEFSEVKNGSTYLSGFGGDTSNFAVAAARQGISVGYQTKVGQDTFGNKFIQLWKEEGIDITQVTYDPKAHTGVYFINYTEEGHQFSYLRKNSASTLIEPRDLSEETISKIKLLHVSGISQAISRSSCDTVFQAIKMARRHSVMVSYDPNVRLKLWPLERARAIIHSTAIQSDVFLPSLEDAEQLTGIKDPNAIIDYYLGLGIKLIALKLGSNGVIVGNAHERYKIEGLKVDFVDATGAGDTFDGAFVTRLLMGDSFKNAALYANAAAALSTMGYGAIESVPTKMEVEKFLNL